MRNSRRRYARTLFEQRASARTIYKRNGEDQITEIDDQRRVNFVELDQPKNFDAVHAFFTQANLCGLCNAIPVVDLIRSMPNIGPSDDRDEVKTNTAIPTCQLCAILGAEGELGRSLTSRHIFHQMKHVI
jgi:hypothetical protein